MLMNRPLESCKAHIYVALTVPINRDEDAFGNVIVSVVNFDRRGRPPILGG